MKIIWSSAALLCACIVNGVHADETGLVCKISSPQDDSPRVFELIIDRQEHRVLECFRLRSGILTQEFSENSIAAECSLSEGGKRSFRITRDTGAITLSEVLTKPRSKRSYTGTCELGQIPPSIPNPAEAPSRIATPQDDSPQLGLPRLRALSQSDERGIADIINQQYGRVCEAKIEGFFSSTLRLDWTSETKVIHAAMVMAAIGNAKETIYNKGIRYLKFPNDVGGYNIVDWKTGEKSSIGERAPYYFP